MKTSLIPLLGVLFCHHAAWAQLDAPLPRPDEQQTVDSQTGELCQSLKPILATAAKSTVHIWAGKRLLAYGTVVGDGHKVLTKWSEVSRAPDRLVLTTGKDSTGIAARVAGVYEDDDLAVLETAGAALTPVQWSTEPPKLGAFLAAPQPDGRPAAFGVVSVQERNLRDTDQAFLGVKPGNIILKVGERSISGLLELKNALAGKSPGATVPLLVQTRDGDKKFSVLLGKRPPLPNYPGDRLRQMEHMGGPLSQVRDGFTRVIQSDMRPQPEQIGGPVVDLHGRVVGITMARADRTRSFIMPAAAVEILLRKPPHDPALAQVRRSARTAGLDNRRQIAPQGFANPGDEERLRHHILDMQRLMDYMIEEMDGLEPNR